MSIRRTVIRGLALAGVAATMAVIAPGASQAAPAQERGTTQQVAPKPVADPAPAGTVGTAGADGARCKYYAGTVRGCGYFVAHDELLIACDRRADGRSVVAQLYWSGAIRAAVRDVNGAKAPCYGLDLNLAEGTPVWVRVWVEGVGYSTWDRATA